MLSSAEIVFSSGILVGLPALCSVAFRSSFIRSLLLDPSSVNDPEGMFQLFYKQVTRELAPKLAGGLPPKVSRMLETLEYMSQRYIGCWRLDLPQLLPFEKIVTRELSHVLESNSLLPLFQFSYKRDQGSW